MPRVIRIRQGLDVPIAGEPVQRIESGPAVNQVGLVGDDYVGMKPTMLVAEGDRVRRGQPLFSDKKTQGVVHTSPAAGVVSAIHRGAKRKFESIVIDIEGDEQVEFASFPNDNLAQLDRAGVRENLIASGLWTALRTRPYSKTPDPQDVPHALFVTAIDTNPLAANPEIVLESQAANFAAGLQVLSTLTDGQTYLCKAPGAEIPGDELACVETVEFEGPHPAGLPGTHMHFLAPVSEERSAWHINYQDAAAIGALFLTGRLECERIVSIAGPAARQPRLVRTQIGANLEQLTADEIKPGIEFGCRVVSGSVLSGRNAAPPLQFLGRLHLQISLLAEGRERELLGWISPGADKFSVKPAFLSSWLGDSTRRFPLTSSTRGSERAIVPIGSYERVVPLDIVPTPLLKALVSSDTDSAQMLGCLELDEEDLALCTFVCPSKHDYGPELRRNLTRIEIEG